MWHTAVSYVSIVYAPSSSDFVVRYLFSFYDVCVQNFFRNLTVKECCKLVYIKQIVNWSSASVSSDFTALYKSYFIIIIIITFAKVMIKSQVYWFFWLASVCIWILYDTLYYVLFWSCAGIMICHYYWSVPLGCLTWMVHEIMQQLQHCCPSLHCPRQQAAT